MNIPTNRTNADIIACNNAVLAAEAQLAALQTQIASVQAAVATARERLDTLLAIDLSEYELTVVDQIKAALEPV